MPIGDTAREWPNDRRKWSTLAALELLWGASSKPGQKRRLLGPFGPIGIAKWGPKSEQKTINLESTNQINLMCLSRWRAAPNGRPLVCGQFQGPKEPERSAEELEGAAQRSSIPSELEEGEKKRAKEGQSALRWLLFRAFSSQAAAP